MKKFLAFLLIMILGAGAYLYSATDGFRRNVDVQKDVVTMKIKLKLLVVFIH